MLGADQQSAGRALLILTHCSSAAIAAGMRTSVAVASERVERVRTGYEAWSRGAMSGVPADVPEDFEFHPPPDLPGEGVYRGAGAMRAFRQSVEEAFGSLRIELVETQELGECVIAHVRLIASGRHSRIDTGREEFLVWKFDGDRPVAGHAFRSREQAMRVAVR